MRGFILALSIFLWAVLGWFYYQSCVECCHDTDGTEKVSDVSDADRNAISAGDESGTSTGDVASSGAMSDYLMFNWSDGEPVLRDDWDSYRQRLIDGLADGENLEITGTYRADEKNDSDFENLGLARANQIKDLISPPIDAERISLVSKLVDDGVDQDKLFASSSFREYREAASIDETLPDRTIIRFPFNSTNKLNDREVEDYLDRLAVRVKQSGESVVLTGHTDNIGGNASNITLGQRRADIIKRYLVAKGVASGKIRSSSKGEASPIASNSSEAGRAQNRRTELQIIK